jgi:hypothetical protein
MAWFKWETSESPTPGAITMIVNAIGWFCIVCWGYAVGRIAIDKCIEKGIHPSMFDYYNPSYVVFPLLLGLLATMSYGVSTKEHIGPISLTMSEPVGLVLAIVSVYFFNVSIRAKALYSVETGHEATFKEYYPMIFLLTLPFIGVWFIQPQVKKLAQEKQE